MPYKGTYALSSYALTCAAPTCVAANLPTDIVDVGGFDSSIMSNLRGGIPGRRGFTGKFESSNVSRENVSREIGRMPLLMQLRLA